MSKEKVTGATKENTISKSKVLKALAIALLVVVFIFFGYKVVTQRADIVRLQNQKNEVSQQLEAQKKENEELQAVLDSDDRDAYIEQKAREKGYVKPDEQVYYDINSNE